MGTQLKNIGLSIVATIMFIVTVLLIISLLYDKELVSDPPKETSVMGEKTLIRDVYLGMSPEKAHLTMRGLMDGFERAGSRVTYAAEDHSGFLVVQNPYMQIIYGVIIENRKVVGTTIAIRSHKDNAAAGTILETYYQGMISELGPATRTVAPPNRDEIFYDWDNIDGRSGGFTAFIGQTDLLLRVFVSDPVYADHIRELMDGIADMFHEKRPL